MSIYQVKKLPTWASLSAGNLAEVKLPNISNLIIACDNDPTGIAFAEKASQKFYSRGITVKIAKPPKEGMDFNDLLVQQGGLL